MENQELYHSGRKGMKWGVRLYQNKDGSLTALGKQRYSKKMEKLKAEKKRLTNEERTKKKLKKLDELEKEVAAKKKAKATAEKAEEGETVEQKKARLLESHNAKEIYKNKDLFTDKEIQTAYNRLNTEQNIKNLIPKEVSKGQRYVEAYTSTSKTIKSVVDASDDLYKSYQKGKALMEALGVVTKSKK